MKQQKWSGLKLSKKELEEVRKEEKLEILAEIIGFFFVLGLIVFCLVAFLFVSGGLK